MIPGPRCLGIGEMRAEIHREKDREKVCGVQQEAGLSAVTFREVPAVMTTITVVYQI